MMNRGAKLFGKDSFENIVSEFGELNIRTKDGVNFFSTPDYLFSDLLKLYQPVDKGGRGLGQSLPSYKLDAVAFEELGVTKLEMADGYLKGYLYNISTYLLYNLFDVLLTYKLDLKLQFYDFLFEMALYNNATMGSIIMGTSKMYSYRNDLDNYRKGVLVRTKRFNSETLSSDYEPKN
jgi:DNA polymerase elongation subunit (family B)